MAEPLTLRDDVHPVPAVLGSILALFGIVVLALGGWGVVIPAAVLLGLASFFAWHCIPSRIDLDAQAITWREKLTTRRVEWTEVDHLSTGLEAEEFAGWVTLYLTKTATGRRGVPVLSVRAPAHTPQKELLVLMRQRWEAAGGSGETTDLMQEMKRTTADLVTASKSVVQLVRGEKPDPLVPPARFSVEAPFDDRGQQLVRLTTTSDDPLAISPGAWDAGLAQAREQRFNPAFKGELEFVLTTPQTPELQQLMDELCKKLSAELERVGLQTMSGEPIKPRWRWA